MGGIATMADFLQEDMFETAKPVGKTPADKCNAYVHFKIAAEELIKGVEALGFDADPADFMETPDRVARAYLEIADGCYNTEQRVTEILSKAFPSDEYQGMVVARDIIAAGLCPHHFLPVLYRVSIGYIPDRGGKVLGVSKLARLVKLVASQPLKQETMTQQIVDALESIGVSGSAVVVSGRHMCMTIRGIKEPNSDIYTSRMTGAFLENPETRQEFLNLTQGGRE
jgi:GTP cyclohydrolase I